MNAFDWSGAPGEWPTLGPEIAAALKYLATMPIEELRALRENVPSVPVPDKWLCYMPLDKWLVK